MNEDTKQTLRTSRNAVEDAKHAVARARLDQAEAVRRLNREIDDNPEAAAELKIARIEPKPGPKKKGAEGGATGGDDE